MNKKRLLIVVAVLVVVLVGLVWAVSHYNSIKSSRQAQGLAGQVLGNTCSSGTSPVCYKIFVVVKSANGKQIVRRATVDSQGNYTAPLTPGTYQVSLESTPAGILPVTQTITILKDKNYKLNFNVSPPDSDQVD